MSIRFSIGLTNDKQRIAIAVGLSDSKKDLLFAYMTPKEAQQVVGQLEAALSEIRSLEIQKEIEMAKPFNKADWPGIDFSALDEED